MTTDKYYTDDVYGIVREVPLNYVARQSVDEKFIEDLSRDKHIVIYGSSKQGKTCLRKHCLSEDEYILVQCSNRWTLSDLHTHVLKRAGFEVTQSETRATSGRNKIMATLSAKIWGSGVDAGAETESTDTTSPRPPSAEARSESGQPYSGPKVGCVAASSEGH